MNLEFRLIGYVGNTDGTFITGLTIDNGSKKVVMMYRLGLSGKKYVPQVANVLSINEIPEWRSIDPKRDFGFTPQTLRYLLDVELLGRTVHKKV